MQKEPVAFFRVSILFNHLHNFGVDPQQLIVKAGISETMLREYESSGVVPALVYSKLYFCATALVPEQIRQSFWSGGFSGRAFHLTAYTMVTAHSLRQALLRVHDLHAMIGERHPHVSISSPADTVRLTYSPASFAALDGYADSAVDAERIVAVSTIAGLVHWYSFLSWMIGQRIKLERVVCSYATGQFVDHENIKRLLNINAIEHLAGDNFIEFSASYLDSPIVVTVDMMDSYLDYAPTEAMPVLANFDTVVERVQALIGQDFSNGFPGFKQLADRLDLSISTLRRSLLAEHSSYQAIKIEARKKLAVELLVNSELSIGDIAEQAGFMSQGSFSRFFREWSSTTPQQYRERHR